MLQNYGQATALGRKSGQSADTSAFPGGKSSPWCCSSLSAKPLQAGAGRAAAEQHSGRQWLQASPWGTALLQTEFKWCTAWDTRGEATITAVPVAHWVLGENGTALAAVNLLCGTNSSWEPLGGMTDSELPSAFIQRLPWIFSLNYYFKWNRITEHYYLFPVGKISGQEHCLSLFCDLP